MILSMKKTIPATLSAGLLALTMAACEQDSADPQQTTVVATTTATTVTETSTSEETTPEETPTEEPTTEGPTESDPEESTPEEESTEPKPTDGPAPECKAPTLAIELERGDAAAGKVSHLLVFRNDGDKACHMVGYPKVFALGKDGKQKIGLQAAEDRSMQPKAVVLKPGKSQKARLLATNIGSNGGPLGDQCKVVESAGFLVTPPNGDRALFAKGTGLKACSGEVDWLTIQPVGSAG